MNNLEKIEIRSLELWKAYKIDHADFEFSCGGDSMNETELFFYNSNGEKIEGKTKIAQEELSELEELINEKVYANVQFYEASDGHYQGETGTVEVKLNDEDAFEFSKSAEAEYNESYTEEADFELTQEQADFIREYVSGIFSDDSSQAEIRYKKDLVLTAERKQLVNTFLDDMHQFASDYQFSNAEGEELEFLMYHTGNEIDDTEIEIDKNNMLKLSITRTFVQYQPSDV